MLTRSSWTAAASPAYGERWGRYWLDLVRYADTSGFETDHFFVTAWRDPGTT